MAQSKKTALVQVASVSQLPQKLLPKIGSRYSGPAVHFDSQVGTYWEVLPQVQADMLRLQRALLKKA